MTCLSEFSRYVRSQKEKGNMWTIYPILLGKERLVIVFMRNSTRLSFEANTGRMLSYSDGETEAIDINSTRKALAS